MIRHTLFAALLAIALNEVCGSQSWTGSPNSQFHIQTDEGPERYFKYQTQSGQYRKEKRLQDGTVVGSYGWIDADGFLRLRDYIADNAGYRILKSKTVFVGQNRPIQDALKSSKNAPAQSGILVKPSVSSKPAVAVKEVAIAVTPATSAYLPPSTTPTAYLPPSSTPNIYLPPSNSPNVYVSPNSIESSTERPRFDFRPTVAPIAASPISDIPSSTPYYSTTEIPTSTYAPSTTPAPIYVSSTPDPIVAITSNVLRDFHRKYSTPKPDLRQYYSDYSTNSLNLDPYSADNTPVDRVDQYRINRYQTPVPARYNSYTGNYLGNGYDPQYPQYDGVSVTNNGFRYYLPRQYHEEENSGGENRSGSFGYVDPFGIRRVIYYNTSPGSGFVHRKNNRYVGLNATPYDPRPL